MLINFLKYVNIVVVIAIALLFGTHALALVETLDVETSRNISALTKIVKQPQVSVKDFGAKGDGLSDDTLAFNNAISAGHSVFVPEGVYIIKNVALQQDTELFGVGGGSVLKQKVGSVDGDVALSANRRDGGGATVSRNMKNIVVRDLQIRGPDEKPTFLEHCHLLFLSAVSDVLIRNVIFSGFKGDGLYIGSGDSGSAERHNSNITVAESRFDGVNHQNRNGISVIDVDGLVVENTLFENIGKANMPGAIDIEPNNHTYHVAKNIVIRNNKFINIHSGAAVIFVYIPPLVLKEIENIEIAHNYSDSPETTFVGVNSRRVRNLSSMNISIRNNTIRSARKPFEIVSGAGIVVSDNLFLRSAHSASIGGKAGLDKTSDVKLLRNGFDSCGTVESVCLTINSVDHVDLLGNVFKLTISDNNPPVAVLFGAGESNHVSFINNQFYSSGSNNPIPLKLHSQHRYSTQTSIFSGNRLNDLSIGLDSLTVR